MSGDRRSGVALCVRIAAWPLAVTLAAVSAFAAEAAAGAPGRGEAAAVTVETGPAIDGTLDDPLWARCPPWPMGPCTSADAPKYRTWAKVLFGPTHVDVGVYCEEPDTDGLRMQHTQRDGPTWADDSVEIFLRPDPRQPYCQFVVNPCGTIYDARDRQAAWNSGAVAKAAIQRGKAWTVTLRIPPKDLSAFVGEDQAWTMNVCRTRPARAGEQTRMYSWAVLSEADYHAAAEFGMVTGIDVPKRPGGVTRVRPGGLPQPVARNRGEEAGGVTVYRRIDFDAGAGGWQAGDGAAASLTDDAAHGKALRVECRKGWAGCELPVNIVGSRNLKIVALMKGRHLQRAGINVYDMAARDNTTAYGYRYLEPDRFLPVLYRLDRFLRPAAHPMPARPFVEIIRYAGEKETKLIFISTYGGTGLKYALVGSVAEKVIRNAPCPVPVVKRTERRMKANPSALTYRLGRGMKSGDRRGVVDGRNRLRIRNATRVSGGGADASKAVSWSLR